VDDYIRRKGEEEIQAAIYRARGGENNDDQRKKISGITHWGGLEKKTAVSYYKLSKQCFAFPNQGGRPISKTLKVLGGEAGKSNKRRKHGYLLLQLLEIPNNLRRSETEGDEGRKKKGMRKKGGTVPGVHTLKIGAKLGRGKDGSAS